MDEVSHKVDAVCCDRECSVHEGGGSDPLVDAVPHAVSVKLYCSADAVDAVSYKVDGVCCDGGCKLMKVDTASLQ